jgi:hypothetical protein
MSTTPNYVALVKLLPTFRNLVDACGEVTLTGTEATQIRLLGLQAEEGRWKVPPVPPELVRDNPLFEHLAIGWDRRQNDAESRSVPTTQTKMADSGAVVKHMRATEADRPSGFRRIQELTSPIHQARGRGGSEVSALAARILVMVERNRGEITKRRLQQKLWRFRATIFNQALVQLARSGRIRLDSKL